MKTFFITQLHTFEHVYEVEAKDAEEALFKLHTESGHYPVIENFHHMNDRQDWEIEEHE